MIIFDTETTDLLKPEAADLSWQPHIVEIALLKLDSDYNEVDVYEALLKPGVPLDEEVHKKITKLTNAELENCPTFLELYEELAGFFLGEQIVIAHNLSFDIGVLTTELRRIGKEYAFPYPPQQICTVNLTKHLKGKRLKLTDLYELTFKKELAQTHRAMGDVRALAEICKKRKVGQ
jgi:DNA polymerase III subunit alpha, Gram-positive type